MTHDYPALEGSFVASGVELRLILSQTSAGARWAAVVTRNHGAERLFPSRPRKPALD